MEEVHVGESDAITKLIIIKDEFSQMRKMLKLAQRSQTIVAEIQLVNSGPIKF